MANSMSALSKRKQTSSSSSSGEATRKTERGATKRQSSSSSSFSSWLALFLTGASLFSTILFSYRLSNHHRNTASLLFSGHSRLGTPGQSPEDCVHMTPLQATADPPSLVSVPRALPTFTDRAGLLIFFHVAKNAGTTIRSFLQRYEPRGWVQVIWQSNFIRNLEEMKRVVEGMGNHTLVVEIHLGPDPSLVELETALHNLRQRANVNHVPFFVLSTVREPLSHAVSFYNYQNLKSRKNMYEQGENNEADFCRITLPNPQCLYFARGERATTKLFPLFGRNLTSSECRHAYQVMTRTVDWIGTVETLHKDTLPLLAYMMEGRVDAAVSVPLKNRNHKPNKIELRGLSRNATEHIRNKTRMDQELYERVQKDYSLDLWTNLPKRQRANSVVAVAPNNLQQQAHGQGVRVALST